MDKKKFDIEAVGASLDRKIRLATSEGKRSLETTKVLRYYNRELPKPIHPRQASYITTDVYDGVEGMKAQLLDIFCTGRELGSFTPQNSKDVEACRIATAYTNYVIFRQNDGFNIFQTIFDDALKARNGFVKVYWSEDKEYTEETFDGIPAEAAEALASMPEVDELDADLDPETGLASGRLTRLKRDRSQVRIEPIAPEDFGIEPQAKRMEGAFHYHRTWMTKAEIKSAGYDVKKLADAQPNGSATSITDITTYTRTEQTDDGYLGRNNGEYKDDMVFEVFECYDYITDKSGKRSLYKIVRCANQTLHIEEIDRSPILSCALLPDGHNFWGKNFASMLIPAQNARTTLSRAVLDHAAISTNPRYLVVKGGLPKPSELLNNQLGGAINVASPDSVVPLAQPALNQFLFPTMEMIKANSEQTTGLTALSQGLNKDVISNQNSQGMINDQVDLAMTRQKVLARNFAYGFLTKLFIEVYRLVLENDKQQNIIEVAGQWAEINPQTWIERKDFEVTLHLTGSDAMMEASKYMTLLTQASQDPALNNMVTAKNRFNLAVKVMTYSGIKNVGDFITPPEQIPPPKPDPMAVAQLQIAQQQAQAGSMAAQATLLKAQTDAQHKQHQEMISEMQVQLNTLKAQADSIRKNIETMSRIDLAQREQALNEDIAARSPPEAGTVRGIISPGI